MDRVIVYPGQAPRSLDVLLTNRNAMNAVGTLLATVLGTGTVVDGLAIAPTAPASLQVQVGQGAIYAQAPVDPNAYSSLPADTSDLIVKQGLVFGTTLLTLTPPATSGQSQVFLVQAAFQEVDGGSTLLPYYNASAPAQPWQGPNNGGTSQFTLRQGQCVIGLKAGVAAPTGSQVAPAADAGYVGLYAITVANGTATVVAGNIATLATAPFLGAKLPALWGYAADSGTVNAVVAVIPGIAALTVGQAVRVKVLNTNTTAATLNVSGLGAQPVVLQGSAALTGGELVAGDIVTLTWTGSAFQLTRPTVAGTARHAVYAAAGSFTIAVPLGSTTLYIRIWGGGGGGGGVYSVAGGSAGGGGGGGYAEKTITGLVPGATYTLIIGSAGAAGATGGYAGGTGGTTSFGSFVSATGGAGGAPPISSNPISQGGSGGYGSGGDINLGGTVGNDGIYDSGYNSLTLMGGLGGGAPFGGQGGPVSPQSGGTAASPGGGGSGGGNRAVSPGGLGAPGAAILEWR